MKKFSSALLAVNLTFVVFLLITAIQDAANYQYGVPKPPEVSSPVSFAITLGIVLVVFIANAILAAIVSTED